MKSTLGAVLLVLASAGVAAGNTIKYTVTNLGAMGGVASSATAINQNGQVVVVAIEYGGSVPSQDYTAQAFVYSNGTTRELGSVDGFTRTMANGINDSGQVVGYSGPPGFGAEYYSHAFINTNGVVTDLAALGDFNAAAINDSGQVVGSFITRTGYGHAFSYINGTLTDLGTLGGNESDAYAVNASGQVVGIADSSNAYRAFLYSNGKMQGIGDLEAAATPPLTASTPAGRSWVTGSPPEESPPTLFPTATER